MIRFIKFTVPGEVRGKGRPRFTKVGSYARVYTDSTTVNYENWVKICFQEARQGKLAGELKAEIICYFGIPKSYSKKKKEEAEKGLLRPTKKPDIDNIAKIILDSLNGMAYDDDKNIVSCQIDKWFDTNPRVEIYIYEV